MKKLLAGAAFAALASISPAMAADMPVEPMVEEAQANWYVSLHGGWKFGEDWDDELDATHGGTEPGNTAELTVETDDGWRVGGALGYSFNDWLAFEGEVGFMTQDFDTAEFEEGFGLAGEKFDLGGDISILTGMVNVIVGLPLGGRFRPYIGGGIGAAHVEADASISDLDFSLDDSDTVFAAQAFAGIDVSITENVAIGGRVRFLHLSDIDLTDDEDHEHSLDPDGIVSAEAVLTFGF